MALTYRTPMEDIVASFEPAVQASIASKAALEYKHLEERNFQIANYHMKAEAKQKLSSVGIYLSPFSAIVHSHPVCKTLENHILYSVLPNYVNNKFFFVGIKNNKVNLLKSRNSNLDLISVINRYVTSADKVRYSNDFVVRSSQPISGLKRHQPILSDVTLKDLVPNLNPIKTKHLFLHDELHYWRPKDLITFLEVMRPEVLLGTVVYPPELLVGAKSSLNPWCYQFEIRGSSLLFYPDGERSEGYEQPLKGGYLLTTNEIELPDGEIYCVDLICSKFAHHLFSITRGSALVNKYRSFGHFEAISFSGLLNLSPSCQPLIPVPFEVVSKLYRYLRSLKKPDLQSAMAKLSQIVPEPSAEEIKFTQEFAELVINCETVRSILSVNRLQMFLGRVYIKVLPDWIKDRINLVKMISLDDFIKELKPYTITKELKKITYDYVEDMFDWTEFEAENPQDLIDNMDSMFSTGRSLNWMVNNQINHHSTPYIGLPPLADVENKEILIYDEMQLVKGLTRILLRSFNFDIQSCKDMQNVVSKLEILSVNRSLLMNIKRILGSENLLNKVRARVAAITAQRRKVQFDWSTNWFAARSKDRCNIKFLCNFADGPSAPSLVKVQWGKVIKDISERCLKEVNRRDSNGDRDYAPTEIKGPGSERRVDNEMTSLLEKFGLQDCDLSLIENYLKLGVNASQTSSNYGESDHATEDGKVSEDDKSDVGSLIHNLVLNESDLNILGVHDQFVDLLRMKLGYQEELVISSLEKHGLAVNLNIEDSETQRLIVNCCLKEFQLDVKFLLPNGPSLILANSEVNYGHLSSRGTNTTLFVLIKEGGKVNEVIPRNICVIHALADALSRSTGEIFNVLNASQYQDILLEFMKGKGIDLHYLEETFKIFGIAATLESDSKLLTMNEEGSIHCMFKLENNHLEYLSGLIKSTGVSSFSGKKDLSDFHKDVLLKLQGVGSTLKFKPKRSRATLLADCLHSGSTGVLMSEIFNQKEHLLGGTQTQEFLFDEIEIRAILGTFGVGKSNLFKQLIERGRGNVFDFVSPRRALLDEIKRDLSVGKDARERKARGQQNWNFNTFEKFLNRVAFLREDQFVFLDEIQLYPNGYLDLFLALLRVRVNVVVFGDPCQSDYDSEKDRMILGNITSNIEALLKSRSYKYNILSYRFENPNYLGRLPCLFATSRLDEVKQPYLIYNELEQLSNLPVEYGRVILVSSFEEKKIVSSYHPDAKTVLTFGESTGLNFQRGTILITMISERASERRWVTALSRFRKNLALINATGYSLEGLNTVYQSRFLGKFLTGNASTEDLLPYLPGNPEFVEGFDIKVGKDEGIREEKLQGDPWLKCMVDLFQLEDVEPEEIQDITQQVEDFKIHLPREELEGTRARWVHKILNKEFREVRMGSLVSDQFTDEHSKQKGAMQLTNAAERFETIYPRHRANDTVTFIMAVKKRLRFSKPAKESSKLKQALPFGKYLLQEFLKKVPLRKNRDHRLMELARQEFFDKKTSKSAATIENHSIRSCREWLADVVQVFSKSQICTKFDNRFRSAKAAQSIACFQHSVLCRFAPYMRYIEKKLHEALPERFYIHSGKSLEQLNDWVIKSDFSGLCTESDYEAFDASQDQYIVAFEIEVMKYLGLPNDLINDYIYIKTHLGSKLGSFAIMRFTGEASTFLFNTMANMLFTFLRYNLKGNENICFAGDDMCSSKRLTVSKEHDGFLSKIRLKAKVQHTSKPTFCGWHLSPDGIYKKPQLVFERICIAKETNNLHNCIDSYAIEISYAYKLGEKVMARMDEEELGAYYGCVRTIIKYKHLLKSDVKALFESLD
nr:replicase polyprotein [Cowpea mild mottle virus]